MGSKTNETKESAIADCAAILDALGHECAMGPRYCDRKNAIDCFVKWEEEVGVLCGCDCHPDFQLWRSDLTAPPKHPRWNDVK